MPLITKPDWSYIWAEGGAVVQPSNTKIQTGWVAEVPPFQWENFVQNRQDQMLAHINQRGIAAWSGDTEYEAGGLSYVQGSDGVIYKSVAASGPATTTQDPTTDVSNTYWIVAFADVGAFLTEASGDSRYLRQSLNGSDIPNTTTFRANIGVYSSSQVDALIASASTLDTTRIDVASASTVNLAGAAPNTRHINITGTTSITGFTVAAGRCYFVRFAGALTLTNSASLVTQTGADISTVAGDTCVIRATAANVVEVLCYSRVQRFTQSASINTTSGTSHDITGIPSWARKVTVILSGVSINTDDQLLVQVGSGSVLTTGYTSQGGSYDAGSGALSSVAGFVIRTFSAAGIASIAMTVYRVNDTEWISEHSGSVGTGSGTSSVANGGGNVTLSGALDRVRLTSVSGTSVFDAGKLTVQYEG
jgi:hypothetical protein